LEYFLFIFFASVAVIQLAGAWQNLKFLLFVRNRALSFILSSLLIIASYYWFFFLGGRQARDTGGDTQLLLFPAATLASMVFTLFLSSIINSGKKRRETPKSDVAASGEGIEVLKEMTYWQAARRKSPADKN